jgi:hypothetical protein
MHSKKASSNNIIGVVLHQKNLALDMQLLLQFPAVPYYLQLLHPIGLYLL